MKTRTPAQARRALGAVLCAAFLAQALGCHEALAGGIRVRAGSLRPALAGHGRVVRLEVLAPLALSKPGWSETLIVRPSLPGRIAPFDAAVSPEEASLADLDKTPASAYEVPGTGIEEFSADDAAGDNENGTVRQGILAGYRQLSAMAGAAGKEWRKDEDKDVPMILAGDSRDGSIARDPRFQQWLRTTQDPHARFAEELAGNLTLEQADLLDKAGGIAFFAAKQGCEHGCLGCVVRAGQRRPIRQMSWEDFTGSVRALVGLQAAMQELRGKPCSLINKDMVHFYDSEPMSVRLTTKDGPPKTILDMVKFLHQTAGVASMIVSAGWNPKSNYAQDAAEKITADIVAGKAPYLSSIVAGGIQIKPVSKRFRDEARAFIVPILNADEAFQRDFGREFGEFGFDFQKYPKKKGAPAYLAYREIVREHLQGFVASSGYLRDRIENIKTLAPAIRKGKIVLQAVGSKLGLYKKYKYGWEIEHDASVLFLEPWMEAEALESMRDFMQPRLAKAMGGDAAPALDWAIAYWSFSHLGPVEESEILGMPIALFNGAIGFSGAPQGKIGGEIPNLATWPGEPAVRQLSDNPVLALDGQRPLWAVAGERLDGTRHMDVTEPVRESIAGRIAEISGGTILPLAEGVRKKAVLRPGLGKRREAWIFVLAAGKYYRFRFADGYLYDLSEPPRLVSPR